AIDEDPSPRSCGKTNHTQWVRLRSFFSSSRAEPNTGACAVTKRLRSKGSAASISGRLHSLPQFCAPAGMPEFDPDRRVIARLSPTTHITVDIRRDETLRDGWAEEQMIDAKARVTDPRIPEIIPEGVDPFTRMKRSQRIGPALREQTVEGFPHLGAEQRVVDPAFRLVHVEVSWHHVEVARKHDGHACC